MKTILKVAGVVVLIAVAVLVVGAIALIRPDIPYAKLQAKYGRPGDAYMVMSEGVTVHYRDEGPRDGRVLLLVHGFSASLLDWDDWTNALSGRYRVIRLDLPGHGLTSSPAGYQPSQDRNADLIDTFAKRLGTPRFVIGGNSMGGGVAWVFALRHPDSLDGLVLVDAGGFPRQGPGKGGPVIFKLLQNPLARRVLAHVDLKPLIGQGLRSAFLDPHLVTPALVERYADFARAPGHRAILQINQTGGHRSVTVADLPKIAVPTLVMHGEQDRLIPFADGQAFARAIPNASLIAYPDVGHVPMEQIPRRSAADLDRWLQTTISVMSPPGDTAAR